jgi:CheY-like chemotaxis protein
MASILLIDDHPDVQEIMARLLSIYGHQVQVCASAEIALESLETQLPEVIIADDRLPGMSGLEFLRHVHKDQRTAKLPVIIISADPSLATHAVKAGARDFWLKGADWIMERMARLDQDINTKTKAAPNPAAN